MKKSNIIAGIFFAVIAALGGIYMILHPASYSLTNLVPALCVLAIVLFVLFLVGSDGVNKRYLENLENEVRRLSEAEKRRSARDHLNWTLEWISSLEPEWANLPENKKLIQEALSYIDHNKKFFQHNISVLTNILALVVRCSHWQSELPHEVDDIMDILRKNKHWALTSDTKWVIRNQEWLRNNPVEAAKPEEEAKRAFEESMKPKEVPYSKPFILSSDDDFEF